MAYRFLVPRLIEDLLSEAISKYGHFYDLNNPLTIDHFEINGIGTLKEPAEIENEIRYKIITNMMGSVFGPVFFMAIHNPHYNSGTQYVEFWFDNVNNKWMVISSSSQEYDNLNEIY